MPQSTLSARRVLELLPGPPSRADIEARLFASKAELADWTDDAMKIEVTADRLDLLSEGGLGLYLAGGFDAARGQPHPGPAGGSPIHGTVDASVSPLRPAFAGLIVEAPDGGWLDEGLLAEAIRFQEVLHATVGRDRRLASLGIYPLERLKPPFRYALEPIDRVAFVPLDGTERVSAKSFFAEHPLAVKFGPYGRSGDRCLTLRDSAGEVLSLPPVLNSRTGGEARVGDRRLLLESTGTLEGRVHDALGLLLLVFVARGWHVSPLQVLDPTGAPARKGPLEARSIPLTEKGLRALFGEPVGAAEVEHWGGKARLSIHPAAHGWSVEVPPWRPDLLAEVDVIEDLLIARGLRTEDAVLAPTFTRGRRLAESRFRDRVGEMLLGLGFVPLGGTVLVGGAYIRRLGRSDAISVANPASELYSHLRDRLLVSLVAALEHNVRHGYPQRFSEVGPVIVADHAAESGGATRYHAAVLLAGERAGLADVAAHVEYLLGALGTLGVREPAELPGMIPGRAARIRLAGEVVAEIGELSPGVLSETGVPVPAAWAEMDLSRLWPLMARAA
ncbi:MAG: hypothetical protein L3K17_03580 [Thermoplasmata archaeon]|nr:hypothetical protein [Thermoplasmata archaeon]